MIKELIVHLGDTKTGSTSIQRALVQKAYELPGTRICYPTSNNHIAMAKTLTRKHRLAERGKRFTRINTALQQSDADYGIVSAEHFQFVDPEVFAGAIAEFWPGFEDRLRLVAYVRPHADKLLSSFSERVKLGHVKGSFEAFVDGMSDNRGVDYMPRFEKWRAVFGDRFTLRPFVRRELHREDAVADFFRVVLGREDFKVSEGISANTSLTVPQLALLREVHSVFNKRMKGQGRKNTPHITEARAALGRITSEQIREAGLGNTGQKFKIPARLADRIQTRYRADADALDRAFFSGTPMIDALDTIETMTTTKKQNLNSRDYFSADVVSSIQVLAEVLSGMLLAKPEVFTTLAGKSRLMLTDGQR
ncbi:hypothetical protein [Pseudophaeobacter sp.]|jgi:hypothetical protein|uniref:hypothetical protein n=1 Tax=Pseudophaeobacter sp. TaxID=1971739 RepID=UPI0032D8EB02